MSAIPFSVFLVWKKALNQVVVFLREHSIETQRAREREREREREEAS